MVAITLPFLNRGKTLWIVVSHIGILRLVGERIIDDGSSMLQHPHAGTAVTVICVDLGDFFADDIGRIEIIDIGLGLVIENHGAVFIGHEDSHIHVAKHLPDIDLVKIKVLRHELFDILAHEVPGYHM